MVNNVIDPFNSLAFWYELSQTQQVFQMTNVFLWGTGKLDKCIKIPFEISSWVVTPATTWGDLVNSGIGRTEKRRGCPGTDPPWGHSEIKTGSCGAARKWPQVVAEVSRHLHLPGSNCFAARAHPEKKERKQPMRVEITRIFFFPCGLEDFKRWPPVL